MKKLLVGLLILSSCSGPKSKLYTVKVTYMDNNIDTIKVQSTDYPAIEDYYQNSNITHHSLIINSRFTDRSIVGYDVKYFKVLKIEDEIIN